MYYVYMYNVYMYIHVHVHIINLCLSSGIFPTRFKSAVVTPLIKKPTLDCEVLNNFRPISNLPFLSKLIEQVIAERLVSHMRDNGIAEKFQSTYKANHSTETALLRVHNDMLRGIVVRNYRISEKNLFLDFTRIYMYIFFFFCIGRIYS